MENKENNAMQAQTEQGQVEQTEQGDNAKSTTDLLAEIEQLKAERDKLKQTVSASNSDASKRKKEAQEWQEKYKSTLDEQKKKEFEAEEANKELLSRLTELETKERVSTYKAKLLSIGFDEQAASSMAETLPSGIADTFFDAQKVFLENLKLKAKTEVLNAQPDLSQGMPPSSQQDAQKAEDDKFRKWMGLK